MVAASSPPARLLKPPPCIISNRLSSGPCIPGHPRPCARLLCPPLRLSECCVLGPLPVCFPFLYPYAQFRYHMIRCDGKCRAPAFYPMPRAWMLVSAVSPRSPQLTPAPLIRPFRCFIYYSDFFRRDDSRKRRHRLCMAPSRLLVTPLARCRVRVAAAGWGRGTCVSISLYWTHWECGRAVRRELIRCAWLASHR